jgi:hypothetical protein
MPEPCPLCGAKAKTFSMDRARSWHVDCAVCGTYQITDLAKVVVQREVGPKKYLLSGLTREASEAGSVLVVGSGEIRQMLESAKKPDLISAIDIVLRHVQKKTFGADEWSPLGVNDYTLVYARDSKEFEFILQKAVELGYLETSKTQEGYRLTIKGWERLALLGPQEKSQDQAFVSMSPEDSLNDVFYLGMKPCLEDHGYHAVRVDYMSTNGKVADRIIAEIRKSSLVVADFTSNSKRVYFEAGFAMGLGIPVIFTCRDKDVVEVKFDTEQFGHIVWGNPADLKDKLGHRIEAVLPNRPETKKPAPEPS